MMTVNCHYIYSSIKERTSYNHVGMQFRNQNAIEERMNDAGLTICVENQDDNNDHHYQSSEDALIVGHKKSGVTYILQEHGRNWNMR